MRTDTRQKSKKLVAPYLVRIIRLDDGERLPMLLRRSDGQPLILPNYYCTSILRCSNNAYRTVEQNMRAVMLLHIWCDMHQINLELRFRQGELLTTTEIESLAQSARRQLRDLKVNNDRPVKQPQTKTVSLEKFRAKGKQAEQVKAVDSYTASIRIAYIYNYLEWLANYYSNSIKHKDRGLFYKQKEAMLSQLKARKPSVGRHGDDSQREGLDQQTMQRLLACIQPDSPDNPWKSQAVRQRNHLIIIMMLTLGVRKGELLGIKQHSLRDLQQGILHIERMPDDQEDPRTKEPNTKTLERRLELDRNMQKLINDYIVKFRSKIPNRNKTTFLFLDTRTGTPLSEQTITKFFHKLRERVPELPDDLCAHMMRHTWNLRFSEMCDNAKTGPEEEQRMRSYLMGWSPTSKTAATYLRRHTREKAQKISIRHQQKLMGISDDE